MPGLQSSFLDRQGNPDEFVGDDEKLFELVYAIGGRHFILTFHFQ